MFDHFKDTFSAFLLILLLFPLYAGAQLQPPKLDNYVYADHIKTVRLVNVNDLFGLPVIELDERAGLEQNGDLYLTFDDLDGDNKNYIYTITQCDADWTLSGLNELEYLDGFNGERIDNFEYSDHETRTPFTHYFLSIPNEDVRITKSGNYILTIYEENRGDDPVPVITRRFLVTENKFKVNAQILNARVVQQIATHQKLLFNINHTGIRLADPQREIKVFVMQNSRWDRMLTGFDPFPVSMQEGRLDFNLQDQVVFPAIKEFRPLDLRSLLFRSGTIDFIEQYDDGFEVFLLPDKKRTYSPYGFNFDINGNFFNDNLDRVRSSAGNNNNLALLNNFDTDNTNPNQTRQRTNIISNVFSSSNGSYQVNRSEDLDNQLNSDYANVHFFLDSPTELYGTDVYLYGALTDWNVQDKYKLEYNEKRFGYETSLLLKQGYYNYFYAVREAEQPKETNLRALEGSSRETENDYTIFVYFRPFGSRYDRLMAVRTLNTHR